MRLWIALAVTGIGLIPWVMLLRLPDSADRSRRAGLSLALPLIAIVIAALAPVPVHPTAQGGVVLGLLLMIVALALLHSGFLPEYSGYAHLLIAYVLYCVAFLLAAGGLRLTPWLLIPLLLAGALTYRLYRRLGVLWGTLMLAGGLLLLAIWAALSWSIAAPTLSGAPLALIGISLIALVHANQVLSRYDPILPTWANSPLAYSLPAHLLISWSLWA